MNISCCRYIIVALILGFGVLFSGCGPSYPKDRVAAAVQSVVKKEYNLDGSATLAGKTLYLEVHMPDLTTTDPELLPKALTRIQGAVLAITRVALSSDAPIQFLVVTAKDPTWKLGMRVIQRLQDVKDYFYQRISKSDYEGRLVLEIDYSPEDLAAGPADVSMEDFAGRLIVSQFNMLARSNPFLGVLLNDFKLQYRRLSGNELTVAVSEYVNAKTMPLVQKLLAAEALKITKKYKLPHIAVIRITAYDNQTVSVMAIPKN